MAEEDDKFSNKKTQHSDKNGLTEEDDQNLAAADIGAEGIQNECDSKASGNRVQSKGTIPKPSNAVRKEENPFSFRHFLKRDLSLPGNSTYENTGARPKVYANTVQHSPTNIDLDADTRRCRAAVSQTKDLNSDGVANQISDISSRNSSVEIPFSTADSSESKHNLYMDNSEIPFYHRPNLASEPLGMPSLPDFVQDHILVEQAYLNSNGPISVDLDNLPDFTFNTNFSQPSLSQNLGSRRNHTSYGSSRDYDYELGAASTSNGSGRAAGGEGLERVPLDLPVHINLDLTESVNLADRRNVSPRNTFPLDLPAGASGAGNDSMRLPDFLPVHTGRQSPARPSPDLPDDARQLERLGAELEVARSELYSERARSSRLEGELGASRLAQEALRGELRAARGDEAELRARLQEARAGDQRYAHTLGSAAERAHNNLNATASRATEAETSVAKLKAQIKKLKEELAASEDEVRTLRSRQQGVSCDLRQAASIAETSLRDLMGGLRQLRNLSSALDPP